MFDTSPDAVVCVDREGIIVAANASADQLFGYEEGELVGQPVEVLISTDLTEHHRALRESFYANPHKRAMGRGLDVTARRKDGTEFPADVNLNPQHSKSGFFVAATIADITELRHTETQLKESEERYRALIDNSLAGFFLTDREGVITFVNRGGIEMFGGRHESDFVGKPATMLYHPDFIEEALGREASANSRAPFPFSQTRLLRLDGQPFDAEVARVHLTLSTEPDSYQIVVRDLTAARQADRMRVRAQAAEENERMKTELLSTVSHEMRTPLTAIRGYATTVLDYADRLDKEDIVEYVHGIEAAAQHLEKIVADLLTLTRLESGVLHFDLELLDLNDVASRAVNSYRVANPQHDVVLEPAARPAQVQADASRLTQVVHNLLDNARKYGDGELARVRVFCESDEVVISVRDSGPGLPAEDLDKIFQPFIRGNNAKTAGTTGSGLGLTICKALLEAQGGRIQAQLPDGRGFEVLMRLPRFAA